ncbi:GMP synthase [Hydrogenophaga crassostreae]|uniref:GMP synthase n=1 Tax=Hydrogenophaga crassostreae TaxID=1763535 RepID=A0A162SRS2_9BURK|nr:glutamine amidotransferase [Hydrogenophaga crassostreae]AOW11696.1 GMP synthase [Hydrogenophaga crassostreae]OAD39789.1 GMP synthase [Hydrogenophaga crassostreae]
MNKPDAHSGTDHRPLLVLKVGHTHEAIRQRLGDFDDWISAGLREGGAANLLTVDPRAGEALPEPDAVAGVVITGSHAMVSDREPWSEALLPWLRRAVGCQTPLLGICYGHQLLAHALGGEVAHHPEGVEIGTVSVWRNEASVSDALLEDLPMVFDAQATHWQSVRRLPPGAVLLAGNAFEPHHVFRVGASAWGVQFHPEFSDQALRAYLDGLGPTLAKEGKDAQAIAAALKPTPQAASLLPKFARLALAGQVGGRVRQDVMALAQ